MRYRFIGIAIGIALAAIVTSAVKLRPPRDDAFSGRLLSECGGTLWSVVIQYAAGGEFTHATYREFLTTLPANVTVYALTPTSDDFETLRRAVGPAGAKLRPLVVGHPITCWSRDRWLTLQGTGRDAGKQLLLCPREENGSAMWPQRTGDAQVAFDLSDHLRGSGAHTSPMALRSALAFDGGDFLADADSVFVTPAVGERNIGAAVKDARELRDELSRTLGKRIVLLDDAPRHHAGMFMASVGDRTMLVGDVRLGEKLLPTIDAKLSQQLPGGPDLSEATKRKFDRVAEIAASAGYRVLRIPTLLSPDEKTYLTYVNGLLDSRAGQKRVYLPIYAGAEAMNAAAEEVWRGVGYDVVPIDCTGVFTKFGTLHCLVNVLERSNETSADALAAGPDHPGGVAGGVDGVRR